MKNEQPNATVISLQKHCETCDYDRYIDCAVDLPNSKQDIDYATKRSKRNFRPHNHPTTITRKLEDRHINMPKTRVVPRPKWAQ